MLSVKVKLANYLNYSTTVNTNGIFVAVICLQAN